jgi:predicted nucleic acid-binding protein
MAESAQFCPRFVFVELFKHKEGTDERDTPYVALTLHMDGRRWTDEQQLETALLAQGFDRLFEP